MADRYITDLPAATSIQDTDALLVDQGNVARMITGSLLKGYINRNILSISVETVSSTTPAAVKSFNPQTGALVLQLPKGIGIKRIDAGTVSGLHRTYIVVFDDDTSDTFDVYDGNGIAGISRTSGTGAPGTSDTYTITFTNGSTTTYQVYNGADGSGHDPNAIRFDGANQYGIYNPQADLDDFQNSIALFSSSTTHYPPTNTNNVCVVSVGDANTVIQSAFGDTGEVWRRDKVGGSWSTWKRMNTAKKGSVSLTTSSPAWAETSTGSGIYTEIVSVVGGTANTKVDLQPTAAQIAQLIEDKVSALFIENNNGIFYAYAVGNAPTTAMTIQTTLTEVSA